MDATTYSSIIAYTGVFIIYGVMEVLGLMPQEIKSAGLTLTGIFGKLYGDLNENFIMYQLRRTTVATVVHLSLPLLYCFGLSYFNHSFSVSNAFQWTLLAVLLWMIGLVVFLVGIGIGFYWFHQDWRRHPLKVQLGKTGLPWRTVATSINLEFRDLQKFISELGGSTIVITDSWILQCNMHSVNVISQRDAEFSVAACDEHRLSPNVQSKQFITIKVISSNAQFKSFDIRLNSSQYTQLSERLLSPIHVARNIIIYQSLSDRFSAAFADQVKRNGDYILPDNLPALDPCVGCLQTLPEVKLQLLCSNGDEVESPCQQCHCKPMWCLSCMSKWFASRQDQYAPEGWMASRATCPMCRATFCMLDVQKLKIHQA